MVFMKISKVGGVPLKPPILAPLTKNQLFELRKGHLFLCVLRYKPLALIIMWRYAVNSIRNWHPQRTWKKIVIEILVKVRNTKSLATSKAEHCINWNWLTHARLVTHKFLIVAKNDNNWKTQIYATFWCTLFIVYFLLK